MSKVKRFVLFFAILVLVAASLVSLFSFDMSNSLVKAQVGTQVGGILWNNTTWTAANSPYNLTNNIVVSSSAKLTIEAGVTINLNGFTMRVDGTLQARGNAQPIIFNGIAGTNLNSFSQIVFSSSSCNWNEQMGSGSIVEKSIIGLTFVTINDTSPKINNDVIDSYFVITAQNNATPIISNNSITANPAISINAAIETTGCATPEISNNLISGYNVCISASGTLTQRNFTIESNIFINNGACISINGEPILIINNSFNDNSYGISINGQSTAIVQSNIFTRSGYALDVRQGNCSIKNNTFIQSTRAIQLHGGNSTIEENLIQNNEASCGIGIFYGNPSAAIRNNTIVNNSGFGITIEKDQQPLGKNSPILEGNNFFNNSYSNLLLSMTFSINATNNWWGTTSVQAINQTIQDYKTTYQAGIVTFVPFLAEPNQEAPPFSSPEPTPTPTSTPSPTPLPTPTSIPTSSPSNYQPPASNPQTTPTNTPSPIATTINTPTPSPTIPEFPISALTITFLTITVLVGVFFRRKQLGRN